MLYNLKRFFYVLFLGLVSVSISNSQNIELNSQEDVDAFDRTIKIITGNVTIGEDKFTSETRITNLDSLSNLEVIEGDLRIHSSAELVDLEGLNALTLVGGELSVESNIDLENFEGLNALKRIGEHFKIKDNIQLMNCNGLDSLDQIDGELSFSENLRLSSIEGFESLASIGERLSFFKNRTLETIDGLPKLKSVGGKLFFTENDDLVSITGFESLESIGGGISFYKGASLENISGFESLKHVHEGISIFQTENLLHVDGFDNLEIIKGDLSITYNNSIQSIPQFDSLDSIDGVFRVTNNDNLISVVGFDSLRYVEGIDIHKNDALTHVEGFNDLIRCDGIILIEENPELLKFLGFESLITVAEDLIIVDNRFLNEIPSFQSLTSIGGILEISGCTFLSEIKAFYNLTDLGGDCFISRNQVLQFEGFNVIDSIHGHLLISSMGMEEISAFENLTYIEKNLSMSFLSELIQVTGFHSLTQVGENLKFNRLDSLEDFDNLNNIEFIGGDVTLTDNYQLTSLSFLGNLDSIHGDLEIRNNLALENLGGLDGVNFIDGQLWIASCSGLTSLVGVENCQQINGNLSIAANDALINLDPLSNLKKIGATLFIKSNGQLNSLEGLGNLDTIIHSLEIIENPLLTNLKGIEGIRKVERLIITDNDKLTTLQDLQNISLVERNIYIRDNASLKDLTGLEQITELSFILEISGNDSLANIDALINLESVGNRVIIRNNKSLNECCGVVNLLNDPDAVSNGTIIENNANGCNSVFEVIESGCNQNFISGIVFFDANENKIKDVEEFGIRGIRILINEDSITKFSGPYGNYFFAAEEGSQYNITPEITGNFELTTDSSEFTINFIPNLPGNNDYHFGLIHDIPVSSEIHLTSESTRCNTDVEFYVNILNDGLQTRAGRVVIEYPTGIQYVSSGTDFSVDGSSVYYDFDSLFPYEILDLELTLMMLSEQNTGETLNFIGKVYYYDSTGVLSLQDTTHYESILLCAFDPNDKQVSPVGVQDENYTLKGEELQYTIRFQNVGNAPAIDVLIKDELDESLDLETFQVINSSFPVQTSIRDRDVEFLFENIWLVDSLTNEPESHGFINYTIKAYEDVEDYTVVRNTAHIFFDFNPAIVTNTTFNTLVTTIPGSVGTSDVGKNEEIIYPNPVTDHVNIYSSLVQSVEIFNSTGQKVADINLTEELTKVDMTNHSRGIYFLKFENGFVQRILKL